MALSVRCPHCDARFALSDEFVSRKVKGRKVKLRCKRCNKEIPVDGTEPARPSKPPPKPASVSLDEPVISRRASAHPPVAGLWVVSYGEHDDRELTLNQLEQAIAAGEIEDSTLIWQEGMPEWKPLASVEELGLLTQRAKARSSTPSKSPKAKAKKPPLPKPARSKSEEERVSLTPDLSALTAVTSKPAPSIDDWVDDEILKLGAAIGGSLDGPPTIDVSDLGLPAQPAPSAEPVKTAPLPASARSDWPWMLIVVAALAAMLLLVILPLSGKRPGSSAVPTASAPLHAQPNPAAKPQPEQKRGEQPSP